MREAPEWILVGMVKRIHGQAGEMLIKPLTEHAGERFAEGSELYLTLKRGEEREKIRIASTRTSDRGPLIRIEGYDSRDEAAVLFGANLFIKAADLRELAPGSYYPFQIEGCEVFQGERRVGAVSSLKETPKANAYIEVDPGGEAPLVLIPFVKEVIKSIDLESQRIEIAEGFLA